MTGRAHTPRHDPLAPVRCRCDHLITAHGVRAQVQSGVVVGWAPEGGSRCAHCDCPAYIHEAVSDG